jgi:hypothetical protein
MDGGDLRVISLERYDKVQLGYAFTTHSLQGDTREASYVLVGGSMQDRELSYVQMSRHRGEAHIYAATEEVGNSLETMADVMSRSRQKGIAQEKREEGLQIAPAANQQSREGIAQEKREEELQIAPAANQQSREGIAQKQERVEKIDTGMGISL